MMMMMMMMNMMNKKSGSQNTTADTLLTTLQKQNEVIENSVKYGGGVESNPVVDDALQEKLKMLEEKLAEGYKKGSQASDGFFNEDMMSMLLLNMQSSMQMMPYIQMRQQQQQKQNYMFQNYLSQMQALNSLLHTMSYGTPLSELNKMHYDVRDKYDGYNGQMKNQLSQILKQAKELKNNEDHYEEELNNSEDEDDILSRLEKSVDNRSGNIRQSLSRENFNLNDREAGGFKHPANRPNPFNPYLANQNYAFSQKSGMSAEDQFKMMMDLQNRFQKMDKPFKKKKKKKKKKDRKERKDKKRRTKASFSSVSQHLLNSNPSSLGSSRYSESHYP